MTDPRPEFDLKSLVRSVPDFPKPGILFRDLSPVLAQPEAFAAVQAQLAAAARSVGAQRVVCIESRGFIFGAPLALDLKLPLSLVRKPGKLPAAVDRVAYALEYGEDALEMHHDSVLPGERVVVVDDLLATGGTVEAACTLVEGRGAQVAAVLVVIELMALEGAARLRPRVVHSLLKY